MKKYRAASATLLVCSLVVDLSVPANIRAEILSVYWRVDMKQGFARLDDQVLRDLTALADDTTPIAPWAHDEEFDLPDTLAMASHFEEAERHRREAVRKGLEATNEEQSLQALTIGDAARTRLAEIAAASGVEDLAGATGGVELRGPCTFTTFPTGTLSFGARRAGDRGIKATRERFCWHRASMDFLSSYPF